MKPLTTNHGSRTIFSIYRFLRALSQIPAAALGLPPHSCRFTPSCSRYCQEAVARFGALHGSWLCCLRILRCGPWTPAGHDPVPPPKQS